MESNQVLVYSPKPQVRVASERPAVIHNKLEALKVLANSILFEVKSLETSREARSSSKVDLCSEVQQFEADLIRCALMRTGGRQRRAAALLGVKPTTLHAKMKRYGMIDEKLELAAGDEIDLL
jgi:DNA-binding NtrC family response regulator